MWSSEEVCWSSFVLCSCLKTHLKVIGKKAFFFLQWNTNEVCSWQNVQAVLFHAMKANDDLSYNFRRLLKYCPFWSDWAFFKTHFCSTDESDAWRWGKCTNKHFTMFCYNKKLRFKKKMGLLIPLFFFFYYCCLVLLCF